MTDYNQKRQIVKTRQNTGRYRFSGDTHYLPTYSPTARKNETACV